MVAKVLINCLSPVVEVGLVGSGFGEPSNPMMKRMQMLRASLREIILLLPIGPLILYEIVHND